MRLAQRGISADGVRYVLEKGKPVHRAGVTHFILRRRDIPKGYLRDDRIAKLEGAVVLVHRDGTIVTIYRNRRAYHRTRIKSKYAWSERAA